MEREGEMRKERGRRRGGGEMRRGRIMALFLIINVLMISCGNAGPVPQEGQAATSDGTIIDLAKVSKKIKNAFEFVTNIEEVKTLVKSITDELAQAIGMKIQNGDTLATDNNHNGGIIAGSFQIISTVKSKLDTLSKTNGISDELKQKVNVSKSKAEAFLGKLKTNHSDLGKEGATDAHAKSAILLTDSTKDKGATELGQLNTAISELLTIANKLVSDAVKELTTPTKTVTTGQSN